MCDYGLFVFGLLVIILLELWRWQTGNAQALPGPIPSVASPTIPVSRATITPRSTPSMTTPSPIASSTTPASAKPDFVLVLMSVDWQSGPSAFQEAAQNQADIFVSESHIDRFFNPKIIVLQDGLQNVSLSNDNLIYDVLEFGLQKQAGDRYIGLTDGDLSLQRNSDIAGWTSGGQAAIAENGDPYIVAHEMGHTFGLCDEYSYTDWSRENIGLSAGCPNPYPADCSRTESNLVNCNGSPTVDGRNSIMGPAGLDGAYGYNTASLIHLEDSFKLLSGLSIP